MDWDPKHALRAELVLGCLDAVVGMVAEGYVGAGMHGMSWMDNTERIYSSRFNENEATL